MSTYLDGSYFLRIASISVACYEYLATLPVEFRVYRSIYKLRLGFSASVVLFILFRYVSIILLILSNVGWFYHGFSAEACARFYMAAPGFKVVQITISQAIVGYRTWNISRRSTDMAVFLIGFGFMVAVLEAVSNLNSRTPVQIDGNCSPGNNMARVPQWVFYLLATIFDVTTIGISSSFLIRSASGISRMSSVLKMLFYDGLGYVCVLIAVNIMNLIMYRDSVDNETQSSGASFGFMVIWIMSQRFLIHIHEAAEARAQQGHIFGPSGNAVTRDAGNKGPGKKGKMNIDVQVQIERAVMIDYEPKVYRKPSVRWDRKQPDFADGDSPERGQWELSAVMKSGDSLP